MSIGTRIIQIRNQKNLTQSLVSQKSGIAASYLSRVENRRLEPGPKTLRRIALALGVPVSQLFEEGPQAFHQSRCLITVSGHCIMELLRSARGKAPRAIAESYTPHQLQLLRMANYLIQSGESRVLNALDVLLNALLASPGGDSASVKGKHAANPGSSPKAGSGTP